MALVLAHLHGRPTDHELRIHTTAVAQPTGAQDHAHRLGMQEHEHLTVAPAPAQVPAISMPLQLVPELPPGVAPPPAAVLPLGRQAAQAVTRHTMPRHRVRRTQLRPQARTVAHPRPVSQHLHPEPGLTAHRHREPTTRPLRLTLATVHTMHRRRRWAGLPPHRVLPHTATQTTAVPGTKKERPVLKCMFCFLLGISMSLQLKRRIVCSFLFLIYRWFLL